MQSKAKKRVRALKHHDPTSITQPLESEWAQFEPAEYKNAPHSFIIHRGKVGRCVKELMSDIRNIMEPYTASNLKVVTAYWILDVEQFFFELSLYAVNRKLKSGINCNLGMFVILDR